MSSLALEIQQNVFIAPTQYYAVITPPSYIEFNQVLDQAVNGATHVQIWDYAEAINQQWRIKPTMVNGERAYYIWNAATGKHLGFGTDGRAYVYDYLTPLKIETTFSALGFPVNKIRTMTDPNTCMDILYNTNPNANGQLVGLKPNSFLIDTQLWSMIYIP